MKITEKDFNVLTGEETITEREETLLEKERRIEINKIRIEREAEYKAKQDARESAIKKLGEIAGLTEEEINSIL
jgi:type I site-specific restriction endonuclease